MTDAEILQAVPMTCIERARIFDVLHAGRWLRSTESRAWVLGRGLESVTLWDVFLELPDGISADGLGGETAVESRFRAFLAEGAIHLDVSLAELTGSETSTKVQRD